MGHIDFNADKEFHYFRNCGESQLLYESVITRKALSKAVNVPQSKPDSEEMLFTMGLMETYYFIHWDHNRIQP